MASDGPGAAALFGQAAAANLARWWAGRHDDRHGPGRLLVPGVLVTAGLLVLVPPGGSVALVTAMEVFGAGFDMTRTPLSR